MCLGAFRNEKFDVIVLAGQSNSEGYGLGQAKEDYLPNERILWLNDCSRPRFEKDEEGVDRFLMEYPSQTYISVAEEPWNHDNTSKVGKLSLAFADAYLKDGRLEDGRKILILNAGVGGTGFRDDQWGVGRSLYKRLKDFARLALDLNEENRLVAFLWHQGECDSFENPEREPQVRYEIHKENLENMLSDFQKEFEVEKLPFIAAGFCDEWYLKNKTPCDAVLKAIKEVFEKRGAFISASGLLSNNQDSGNGDDIHFCRESLRILGNKYYEAFKNL